MKLRWVKLRWVKLRWVKLRRVKHTQGLAEERSSVKGQHRQSGSLAQSVRQKNHTGWEDVAVVDSERQRRFLHFTTVRMRRAAWGGKGCAALARGVPL